VRDAEPEHEAAAGELGQGVAVLGGDERVVGVDVGDARRDGEPLGAGQQVGRRGVGVATGELRDPEGIVVELFDAPGEGVELGHGEAVGVGDDARAVLHGPEDSAAGTFFPHFRSGSGVART
jgi:hypothetical protein